MYDVQVFLLKIYDIPSHDVKVYLLLISLYVNKSYIFDSVYCIRNQPALHLIEISGLGSIGLHTVYKANQNNFPFSHE